MSKLDQMALQIATARATAAAVVPVAPDTGVILTPIEQMNKPVKGTQANLAVGGVTAAALYLISKAGWMPAGWQDDGAQYALTLLLPWALGGIANFVASYRARDKRFQA